MSNILVSCVDCDSSLQLLFSQVPYIHRKNNRLGLIFQDIRCGVLPGTHFTEDFFLWAVLQSCWHLSPSDRPSASKIAIKLDHPRFKDPPNKKDEFKEFQWSAANAIYLFMANFPGEPIPESYFTRDLLRRFELSSDIGTKGYFTCRIGACGGLHVQESHDALSRKQIYDQIRRDHFDD